MGAAVQWREPRQQPALRAWPAANSAEGARATATGETVVMAGMVEAMAAGTEAVVAAAAGVAAVGISGTLKGSNPWEET